jgi:hypothetical protein
MTKAVFEGMKPYASLAASKVGLAMQIDESRQEDDPEDSNEQAGDDSDPNDLTCGNGYRDAD